MPQDARTEELTDLVSWLGEVVRGVDSSLLDEWEALAHPDPDELDPDAVRPPSRTAAARGITANERAFTVMVRNALFRRVELLATRRHDMLGELDTSRGWPAHVWADAMAAYWDEYPDLGIGAHARSAAMVLIRRGPRAGSCGRSSTTRRVTETGDCRRRWTSLHRTRRGSRC